MLAGTGWQLSWILVPAPDPDPGFARMTKESRVVLVMPDLIRHPLENDSNFPEKSLIFQDSNAPQLGGFLAGDTECPKKRDGSAIYFTVLL
jgi:hypothetical protein